MNHWHTLDGRAPRVIAHRGASGLRPEHTLEGYRLAIEQGCDIIEPDLVPTRDAVLIARHESALSRSTDVCARSNWHHLAIANSSNGPEWHAHDYDLPQLRMLRAVQPFAGRSAAFDGQFVIPTFDDIIELARSRWRIDQSLGVYPEIKHPSQLLSLGIDSTALLIASLLQHGLSGATSPVWVQCFELPPLQRVHAACANPTFALFDSIDAGAVQTLHDQAPWLDGIAVSKSSLIGPAGDRDVVRRSHQFGWQVHVWTLRDDAVMAGYRDVDGEYDALFALGVDALFCDFPASAVTARLRWPGQFR